MYMNNNEKWQARLDPKSGKPYWKNLETGIKTWKNPQIRTEIQEGTNSPSKPKKSKQLLTNNVSNNINSSSDDSADNNNGGDASEDDDCDDGSGDGGINSAGDVDCICDGDRGL